MRKMKVAVTAWKFGSGGLASDLAEQGEIAEQMGFDSFWLPESHFAGDASIPSPLILLAAIAARTSKIKLGSTSYLLPIRHPIQAAEEVAVLDRISNGRVILGVGRGFQDAMFTVFNIPTKDKRKLFKSNLQTMKDAWAGKPIAHNDDGSAITLSPLPTQKPHPPIWVAAFGPLAIRQAGSLGLPYIASPAETLDALIEKYDQHQGHANDAGHEKIHTVPVMRTIFISNNKMIVDSIRDNLDKEATHRMRDATANVEDWVIVGDQNYVVDKIAEYQERLGLNYLIARGRITGVSNDDQIASHEQLARITS